MQALTTREGTGYVLSPERYDAGVNRLGALERMWADLEARQAAIPGELQALREAGKEKTVKFGELMAEKLTNAAILSALERAERWG